MVKLEPIEQEDFDRFLESEIRNYADDHVRNGNWSAEGALEKSRKEFESLLPDASSPRINMYGLLLMRIKIRSVCCGYR